MFFFPFSSIIHLHHSIYSYIILYTVHPSFLRSTSTRVPIYIHTHHSFRYVTFIPSHNMPILTKPHLHHQPINVPTAGAWPSYGLHTRRTGQKPPRRPSSDWVLTTANAAGTNGFTRLPQHEGANLLLLIFSVTSYFQTSPKINS
jgi:hypothetical protein